MQADRDSRKQAQKNKRASSGAASENDEKRKTQKELQKKMSRCSMSEEERGVANLARRKKHQPRCWDALVLAEGLQAQASETGDDTERQRLLEGAAK